ncbi:MAG: hypothetical protein OD918_08515 [Gammaproteobacteria bacterium]
MANRPVFIPVTEADHLLEVMPVDFSWNPGFSPAQKKKNVAALHHAAAKIGLAPLLEVSTKSDARLGMRLSAFSLKIETTIGKITLEAAYQGSKVFEKGGPYADIYAMDAKSAKQDPRIRNSGALMHFDFFGARWPLAPQTAFYDWLYLTCLQPHQEFLKRLRDYKGFTDIEFNPQKSVNCQARACALLVSLLGRGALDDALRSPRALTGIIASAAPPRDRARQRQENLAAS